MSKPWYRINENPTWISISPDNVLLETFRGEPSDLKAEDEIPRSLLYSIHTVFLAGRASMAADINNLLKEGDK
jgi:hypothetical protein